MISSIKTIKKGDSIHRKDVITMTRNEAIKSLIVDQNNILKGLSDKSGKPKKCYEDDWNECREKIAFLKQILKELPSDQIDKGEATGYTKQVFTGTFGEEPALYHNIRFNIIMDYFVYMTIMNSGEEGYQDTRFLRLSYKIYEKWFKSGKYEQERQERAEENLCTNIKAIVKNDRVMELRWMD